MQPLDYETALAKIFSHCPTLPITCLAIENPDLMNRILAEDLHAPHSMPKAPISAMDGYALMMAESSARADYRIIGESAAGNPFKGAIQKEQAVKIFTGALIPEGADSVIIKEETKIDGDMLTYQGDKPLQKGGYIREKGLDFKKHALCLQKYTILNPRHLALMASMNIAECAVFQRPKIAIISTGDELRKVGTQQETWQIASSNDIALRHLLPLYGGIVAETSLINDDKNALSTYLQIAIKHYDIVVLSGGVSIGDYDLVAQSLAEIDDFTAIFHGVTLRPGKPSLFGKVKDCLIFGLPGNPVSAILGAMLFIVPAIQKMQGLQAKLPVQQAILADDLPAEGKRTHYRRARFYHKSATLYAEALPNQDSAQLSMLAQADGLIICPANSPAKNKGELIEVIPFPAPITQQILDKV